MFEPYKVCFAAVGAVGPNFWENSPFTLDDSASAFAAVLFVGILVGVMVLVWYCGARIERFLGVTPKAEKADAPILKEAKFSYVLGRAVRKHVRWWHVGLLLTLLIAIACFFGALNSLGILVLLLILGCGTFWTHWVVEDKKRARGTITGLLLLLMWIPLNQPINRWLHELLHPGQIPPASNIGPGSIAKKSFQSGSQSFEVQKPSVTLNYWQMTVANLHQVRFGIPKGDEPTGEYLDRWIKNLRGLTERAKSASAAGVDQDLVNMVQRHLAIEDHFEQIKQQLDDMWKKDDVPTDVAPVSQRFKELRTFLASTRVNSSILDTEPRGPMRSLFEKAIELEQMRLNQFRDIEIRQAVLEERYPGTKFPLPDVAQ